MRYGQSDYMNTYHATFKLNGEEWPFSATAVTDSSEAKVEHRTVMTGDDFRVVTMKPTGTRRSTKPGAIRVTFDLIELTWLQRLENLKEKNQAFECQLIAYDARDGIGVPLMPVTPYQTRYEAPSRVTVTPALTGGSLTGGSYAYRISAVVAGKESPLGPTILAGLDATTTGKVDMTFAAFPGPSHFRLYGRVLGLERYIGEVANPGTGTFQFSDTGAITPGGDPGGAFQKWYGSNETRWCDDPDTLVLQVGNQVIANYTLVDHNGAEIAVGAGGTPKVYTQTGEVEWTDSSRCSADQVYMKYIWEPKVAIDSIERQPIPVQSKDGKNPGFLYTANITLYEVK